MARAKTAPPRGIIRDALPAFEFRHQRYEVDPPLDASIEHWWSVAWRLPKGERQERRTLPHPSVHVVLEEEQVRVVGVVRGRFTWVTQGAGYVFAAKFWPGAFRPLLGAPVSTLTDRVVPFSSVVGAHRARQYREGLLRCADDHQRVAWATEFFSGILPPPASDAALLRKLVDVATSDRSLTTVEALREHSGLHLRELQRWFRDAVGISPKWMIQRYRLHDALLLLESGDITIAQAAADLGYTDQAHFARDFKALVGQAPSRYLASNRLPK